MLSEEKNIDQVFREKTEAFNPGRASLEADWAGISNRLPVLQKRRRPVAVLWRSAAAVAAMALLFFAIKSMMNNKTAENGPVQQPVAKENTPVTLPLIKDTTHTALPVNIDSLITSLKLNPIYLSYDWLQPDNVQTSATDTAWFEEKNTPEPKSSYEIMAAFNEQVAVAPQSFTINNNRDNTLNFKKGTSVFIPANTFYSGGQLINGEITFSVTEYYTLGEMAAAKLNTTAGGQMLKSGGMLFIKAMYNNQEVDAGLQKELVVQMPAVKGFDNEMELFLPATAAMPEGRLNLNSFAYDNAGINTSANSFEWQSAGQVQYQSSFRSNDFVQNLPDVKVPTIEVVQPWKVIERTNTAVFLTDHLDVQEEAGMKAKLKEKFPQYTIKLRNTFIGRKRFVKTDDQGQNISKVKKWDTNTYNIYSLGYGPKKGLPVFIGSLSDSIFVPFASAARRGLVSRQDSIRFAKLDELRQVVNTGMDTLAKRYRFSLNRLGWINCDRFYSDSREKTPLYVQLPGDLSDYSVHVIFPKINAIMGMPALTEKGFLFMNVPIGEPIYAVVVGTRNRKVLLGFKKTNTGKDPIKDIPLEEADAEAYKQKMTELN